MDLRVYHIVSPGSQGETEIENDTFEKENIHSNFIGSLLFLWVFFYFLKILCIFFRQRGREGERDGEKHQCVVASQAPSTGDLAWNPYMCPRLRIKPAMLWFAGQQSIHWATPARAVCWLFEYHLWKNVYSVPLLILKSDCYFSVELYESYFRY